MDFQTYALSNGPFVFFNIVTAAFYTFCMVFPLPGEQIKQPLKLLLGCLVCCTITYKVSVIVVDFSNIVNPYYLFYVVMVCSMYTSMTSSVWLNFFYCCQIVPAKRAFFIWIKKNVKSIIYCIWFTERIYSLFDFTTIFLLTIDHHGFGSSNLSTEVHHMTEKIFFEYFRQNMFLIVFIILKAHFVFCLCVMLISSGSTILYLCGHMRRMVANGQSLSCPQIRNQLRVTVTGILQGVLYAFCAFWTICSSIPGGKFIKIGYTYTDSTVINLYMSGTLFNLGAGQAVFRQRAAHIWLRAAQWCKAPQVQQSEEEDGTEAQTRRPGLC
ncbi:taste receptor type 2 member 119-like [Cyclopterus lumpus]|nr:taste receptor type 2 member 119-like [Cyclopterus lumpus]